MNQQPHADRRNQRPFGARRQGRAFLAQLSRRLCRFKFNRFRTPTHSSPSEKWADEGNIAEIASIGYSRRQQTTSGHVRQNSKTWDDLTSIVHLEDLRAASDGYQSTLPTQVRHQTTQSLFSSGVGPSAIASQSEGDVVAVKRSTMISGSETPSQICLLSPPHVRRMSCSFDFAKGRGRGRERWASSIDKVARRLSPPVQSRRSFSFGFGISGSGSDVPQDYSESSLTQSDNDKEDSLSLAYTTSSLEYSSSLMYSDDDLDFTELLESIIFSDENCAQSLRETNHRVFAEESRIITTGTSELER